mgnify:FL=1
MNCERMIFMTVKVFSTKVCPWCVKAKEFLDELGVAYETVDVSENRAAAMEMVRKTKQMGVPVVQIGDKYIVGFNANEIRNTLKENGLIA